jgi:hypothetical protein
LKVRNVALVLISQKIDSKKPVENIHRAIFEPVWGQVFEASTTV